MSDYLSPELVEKILLKLPVKSLLRFTTVCKLWRSIITNPSFISSHLYKPQNETLILRSYNTRNKKEHYSLLEVDLDSKEEYFSLLEIANSNPFTIEPFESRTSYFRIVGSCRGVVCLTDGNKPSFLWNPRIGKHVVLPKPTIDPKGYDNSVYGFGVAGHDFKVVRLVYYGDKYKNDDSSFCAPPEAEVFSLRTGKWRRFGVEAGLPNVRFAWCCAFVNGVVHWLGHDSLKGSIIVVFRFAQEVFHEIALPDELATEDYYTLDLFSVGGSLALIQDTCFGMETSVWLMQAYGDESSWTRKYVFSLGLWECVVAIRKKGEVLVESRQLGLYALDLKNVETKTLVIDGVDYSFHVENYVESLELLGGERDFAEE